MGAEFENLGVPSDAERPSPTATAEFARIRTVDVGLKIEFKLRADSATYPRNCSRLEFTGGWFTRLGATHERGVGPALLPWASSALRVLSGTDSLPTLRVNQLIGIRKCALGSATSAHPAQHSSSETSR